MSIVRLFAAAMIVCTAMPCFAETTIESDIQREIDEFEVIVDLGFQALRVQ